jgi:CheY-like chemotaxis protein
VRSGEKLYAYFVVEDTGIGMSSEELVRLFQRFSQAQSKTHITYGGSGLGLYICKELAQMQGGGIGVASSQGAGSTFVVFLETKAAAVVEQPVNVRDPITTKSSRADGSAISHSSPMSSVPHEHNTNPNDQEKVAAPADSEGIHVLLVEDNLINQKVLARQLRKANCTVFIANHGEEALTILEQSTYWKHDSLNGLQVGTISQPMALDVVLMDIEMPVMDGLQCTKQIRLLQSKGVIAGHVPIIATTANARQEQKDKVISAGVDRILVKPFTIDELMLSIRELVG